MYPVPASDPVHSPCTSPSAQKAVLLGLLRGSTIFVPPSHESTRQGSAHSPSLRPIYQPLSKPPTYAHTPLSHFAIGPRNLSASTVDGELRSSRAAWRTERRNSDRGIPPPAPLCSDSTPSQQNLLYQSIANSLEDTSIVAQSDINPATQVEGSTQLQIAQLGPSPMSSNAGGQIRIPGFDPSKYGRPTPASGLVKRSQDDSSPRRSDTLSQQQDSDRLSNLTQPSHVESVNEQEQAKVQIQASTSHSLIETPSTKAKQLPLSSNCNTTTRPSQVLVPPARQYQQRGAQKPSNSSQFSRRTPALNQNVSRQNGVTAQNQTLQPQNSPASTKELPVEDETPEQTLKRIQALEMRRIGYRNRNKGDSSTTSLKDLELARRPLPATAVNIPRSNLQPVTETAVNPVVHAAEPPPSSELTHDDGDKHSSPKKIRQSSNQMDTQSLHVVQHLPNWGETQTLQELPHPHPAVLAISEDDQSQKSRNLRWCTPAELRPIYAPVETDSNVCGSDVPSDEAVESNDSVEAMHHGRLFRSKNKNPDRPEHSLAGWDGKLQPPPVDWNDRPRFNNDTVEFKNGFNNWANTTAGLVLPKVDTFEFRALPIDKVLNIDLHPDGLSMVPREFVLDYNNAEKYGYVTEVAEATQNCLPYDAEDFEDWAKIDLSIAENRRILQETTEDLVQNWNAQQAFRRESQDTAENPAPMTSRQILEAYKPAPNPNRPKANIYLRPAVRTDLLQCNVIYNWHIENTPRTAETEPIDLANFRYRYDNAQSSKLPFIVAALKNKTAAANIGVGGAGHNDMIVGFACAQDFTCPDYVERISAEVEIYVHNQYYNKGIGRCLLDQILEATDRGHLKKGGYTFTCAPEISHMYNAGGGRDLHKLIFMIRHWKEPVKARAGARGAMANSANGTGNGVVEEDDVLRWVKPWLERWDFEQEGCLKGAGAKNGRFLNLTYLCKETKWQPAEGRIPEYHPPTSAA